MPGACEERVAEPWLSKPVAVETAGFVMVASGPVKLWAAPPPLPPANNLKELPPHLNWPSSCHFFSPFPPRLWTWLYSPLLIRFKHAHDPLGRVHPSFLRQARVTIQILVASNTRRLHCYPAPKNPGRWPATPSSSQQSLESSYPSLT